MTFCHLNVHSDRSILKGMIKPKQLVAWCKSNGVAAAITDSGNMNAAIELNKQCKAEGVKPIFGFEANVVPDKTIRRQGGCRLILLAKNKIGFKNLIALTTIGSMYFYYIPRIDLSDVKKYCEGLIVLTADIGGPAAAEFFIDGENGIRRVIEAYSFLGNDFYLEIQPVPIDSQRAFNVAAMNVSLTTGCGLIATNNCFYADLNDVDIHEKYVAIKQTRNEAWTYPYKGYHHLATREEMFEMFSELHGDDVSSDEQFINAIDAGIKIADSVEQFDLRDGTKVPVFCR